MWVDPPWQPLLWSALNWRPLGMTWDDHQGKKRLACIDIIEWDISLLRVLLVGCVDNLLRLSEVCSTGQLKFCQLQKANKQLLADSRPRPKGSKRYGNMVWYYSYPLATVSSSLWKVVIVDMNEDRIKRWNSDSKLFNPWLFNSSSRFHWKHGKDDSKWFACLMDWKHQSSFHFQLWRVDWVQKGAVGLYS